MALRLKIKKGLYPPSLRLGRLLLIWTTLATNLLPIPYRSSSLFRSPRSTQCIITRISTQPRSCRSRFTPPLHPGVSIMLVFRQWTGAWTNNFTSTSNRQLCPLTGASLRKNPCLISISTAGRKKPCVLLSFINSLKQHLPFKRHTK